MSFLKTQFIRTRNIIPSFDTTNPSREAIDYIEALAKKGVDPPAGIGKNIQTPGIYTMRMDGVGGQRTPAKFHQSQPGEKTSGNPGILYTFTVLDGAFANTPFSSFDRIDMKDESKNWYALRNLDAYTEGKTVETVTDALAWLNAAQPTYRIKLESNTKNGVSFLNPTVISMVSRAGVSSLPMSDEAIPSTVDA